VGSLGAGGVRRFGLVGQGLVVFRKLFGLVLDVWLGTDARIGLDV
jgi:hypothetical protein